MAAKKSKPTKAKKAKAKPAKARRPAVGRASAPKPATTKAKPIAPIVRRARGGRKVTTGRRSAGAGDLRVRTSAEEQAAFEELARQAGAPSVAAWLRSQARKALAAARPAEAVSEAPTRSPWPSTFIGFAEEVLGLKLTTGQRALARVAFDGVDPRDLEDREERRVANELFGGVERVPASARRALLVLRLGRASGKSLLTAAWAVWRLLVADLSACGPGDTPAVCIVSPRRDTSRIIGGYARHFATTPEIAQMVTTSAVDGFAVRRHDGREVQFKIVPKSMGGASLRGFSLVALVVDESEFVPSGGPAAVIQDDDIIDAAIPRGLPGFLCVLCSTPWPATSATARAFTENFGHPTTALAALGPTLTMRDHDPVLAEKVADELRRNPVNATREYECVIPDEALGGAFFSPSDIKRAIAEEPIAATKKDARAGIDPAFVNDSFAMCIVEEQEDGALALVHHELVAPKPQSPLVPSVVVGELAKIAASYGVETWYTDKHRCGTVRVHASGFGVETEVLEPEEAMIALRDRFREGKIRIPNDPRLVAQLRAVTFKPRTGGGLTISQPRTRESGHGDLVSALAMACAAPSAAGWDFQAFAIDARGPSRSRGVADLFGDR